MNRAELAAMPAAPKRDWTMLALLLALVALVAASFASLPLKWREFFTADAIHGTLELLAGFAPPNVAAPFLLKTAWAAVETMAMSALGTLAAGLICLAVLAAAWLARHLLRPVAALRGVTARLARGELDARAPLLSRDELAELALHVNAMAEALEDSERQRRKMLADVSHELRTPLTVIRGEIEALLDGIRQADAGALASLHAEVLRLNQLVDDLHQLTLADAGDLQYDWQPLDLPALLQPLLARYQPRAAKAGLDLSWSLPALLPLRGDGGRLTQVVTNLLENSVRYTDPGGQIVLALAAAGNHAELWIEDSAPGVPSGAHGTIFERLYRVDAARTRERGGSGLGLAICRALVEAHGGAIAAAPSALGGLKITVRLPLQPIH